MDLFFARCTIIIILRTVFFFASLFFGSVLCSLSQTWSLLETRHACARKPQVT
jgi:hypothetical protein